MTTTTPNSHVCETCHSCKSVCKVWGECTDRTKLYKPGFTVKVKLTKPKCFNHRLKAGA